MKTSHTNVAVVVHETERAVELYPVKLTGRMVPNINSVGEENGRKSAEVCRPYPPRGAIRVEDQRRHTSPAHFAHHLIVSHSCAARPRLNHNRSFELATRVGPIGRRNLDHVLLGGAVGEQEVECRGIGEVRVEAEHGHNTDSGSGVEVTVTLQVAAGVSCVHRPRHRTRFWRHYKPDTLERVGGAYGDV